MVDQLAAHGRQNVRREQDICACKPVPVCDKNQNVYRIITIYHALGAEHRPVYRARRSGRGKSVRCVSGWYELRVFYVGDEVKLCGCRSTDLLQIH